MTEEQAKASGAVAMGYEAHEVDRVVVEKCDGHSGFGWYVWDAEYPEEGSRLLVRIDAAGLFGRAAVFQACAAALTAIFALATGLHAAEHAAWCLAGYGIGMAWAWSQTWAAYSKTKVAPR